MAIAPDQFVIDDSSIGKRLRRLENMAGLRGKEVAAHLQSRFPHLKADESKVSRWKQGKSLSSEVLWCLAALYAELLAFPRGQVLLFMFGEAELSFNLRLVEGSGQPDSEWVARELNPEPTDSISVAPLIAA